MLTLANFLSDFFIWLAGPWMPADGGGFADNVDALNGFVFAVCYFFAGLIGTLMVWFCIKYRQKDKQEVGHGAHHSTPIEIAWTLPPLVIVLIIFAVGFKGFMDMAVPPQAGNAFTVRAEAKMWGWNFYYPNGGVSETLYVPSDRPTKITLESIDVLHSLFIPAMRIKKDVVPGRFNEMWFEPDASVVSADEPTIDYRLHCTEYCGQGHSQMNGYVRVVHPTQWADAMDEVKKFNPSGLPPVALGEELYSGRGGCAQCHSVDGAPNTGPTWLNLYGSQRELAVSDTGEMTVTADYAYMNESIRYPNRKKAVGYANANMSAYSEAVLKPGDVFALVEYMKTLSDQHEGEVLQEFPEGYDGNVEVDEFVGEEQELPEGSEPEDAEQEDAVEGSAPGSAGPTTADPNPVSPSGGAQ